MKFIKILLTLINAKSIKELKLKIKCIIFENILKYPIVYEDKLNLKYILYPNQNAGVYITSGGNYEIGELNICKTLIKEDMTVLDIGANIGMYSIPFSKFVGPNGIIHSFEPELKNFKKLSINIDLNDIKNIKINNNAVFSETKIVSLNVFPDEVNSWHTLGNIELDSPFETGKKITHQKSQDVLAYSIDDYCEKNSINQIDFMKIDVEGAEFDVLKGCEKLFKSNSVKYLMFEISLPQVKGMGHNPIEIINFLKKQNMNIFKINQNKLEPFDCMHQNLSLYQNFLAVNNKININNENKILF